MHRLSRAATSHAKGAGKAGGRTDTRTGEVGAPESFQELEVEVTDIAPSPLAYVRSPTHENAGATEPRRLPNELENVRRSRYFFLAAFFLAAGFLAAFFLAAMLVYLLHSISDPMNLVAGPKCIPRKGLPAHQLVASVIATMSSTTFKLL